MYVYCLGNAYMLKKMSESMDSASDPDKMNMSS